MHCPLRMICWSLFILLKLFLAFLSGGTTRSVGAGSVLFTKGDRRLRWRHKNRALA